MHHQNTGDDLIAASAQVTSLLAHNSITTNKKTRAFAQVFLEKLTVWLKAFIGAFYSLI